MSKRIYLIGYMGCGKTTIGQQLAQESGLQFIDIDQAIERRFRKTVRELFAERGEEGFREIERKMLQEVSQFEDIVISTGGGLPCFFDNMQVMNATGDTVYLKLSPAELAAHLSTGKVSRPLLKDKQPEELQQFITEHLAQREPFYSQAKHIVSATDCTSIHISTII
jgi:shikimate kinase